MEKLVTRIGWVWTSDDEKGGGNMSGFAMIVKKEGVTSAGRSTNRSVSGENRTGIPTQLKERMEQSTGLSFDDVRVHYNSVLPAKLDALAYTQGDQVEISPGQEHHLPHELGHVVQQKLGIVHANGRHSSGAALNTDPELEHQADEIAAGRCNLAAQHNTEQGFEAVVQRQFDANALVDRITKFLPEGEYGSLKEKLLRLKQDATPKAIKKELDDNERYMEGIREKINQLFREEVKRNQLDADALVDLIIASLPEGENRFLKERLLRLKKHATTEAIERELDNNKRYKEGIRKIINDLFFEFYGIEVSYLDEKTIVSGMGLKNEEFNYDEVKLHDESSLVNALNDIYATKTGAELLELLADGKTMGPQYGVSIRLGFPDVTTMSKGNIHDEQLQVAAQGGYDRGTGAGTIILLYSEDLVSKYAPDYIEGEPPVILAHELIHALHAQMGVKPSWEILEKLNCLPNAFLHSFPEFIKGATPDDVPVTGIRDDIVYPNPLEAIKHINENKIREELGMGRRMVY